MVRTDKDKISDIVEVIKVEHLDDNKKIAFLAEKLSLVYSSPHGRRYSPSLIAMAYMWQSVSPALYKQVQLEGILTLPSAKYVRTLSSSIGDDFELTQPAKRYMSARFQKLKETDHEVSLIMDEVYCQKKVQYSNGAKSPRLLCLMIKSICGKYRDIISMTPITNINATILYTIWQSNIKVLTEVGFNVAATITDGHESNVKFYAKLIGTNPKHYYVNNLYFPGRKIFLLFNPVHLFKNFYNNFMNYSIFRYPTYDQSEPSEEIFEAKFSHVKDIFHIELGKSIKMAHKLNDKMLNPSVLEKN